MSKTIALMLALAVLAAGVLAAGSSGAGSSPGSVRVSEPDPALFAHALADALASQMKGRGQYIIVPCKPANPIVGTWLQDTKAYIPQRYPRMQLGGVVVGSSIGNDAAGTLVLGPTLKAHPHLRGLIFLCQSESFTGPPQLVKAHLVGKVFTAGQDQPCPPLDSAVAWNVRHGAEEIICDGKPSGTIAPITITKANLDKYTG
jgi:ABC-type sugar transport system substrate-binding protein